MSDRPGAGGQERRTRLDTPSWPYRCACARVRCAARPDPEGDGSGRATARPRVGAAWVRRGRGLHGRGRISVPGRSERSVAAEARHGATLKSSVFWNVAPSSSWKAKVTVMTASFRRFGRSYHTSNAMLTGLPTPTAWFPDALNVMNS